MLPHFHYVGFNLLLKSIVSSLICETGILRISRFPGSKGPAKNIAPYDRQEEMKQAKEIDEKANVQATIL